MSEVTLTAAMRNSLTSLQQTNELMTMTQGRLATGKKVNDAVDNPSSYFAALAHRRRADDLSMRKDGMMESIQAVKASSNGIEGMTDLLETARGLIQTARTTTSAGLGALQNQFNEVISQIKQLVADSGYKGTNFLNGTAVSLDVLFNETGTNKLTLTGFDGGVSALMTGYTVIGDFITNIGVASNLGGTAQAGVSTFAVASLLNDIENAITATVSQLEVQSAKMAANLSVINARLDFSAAVIGTETMGADNLTLADTNEEGANMLMLQTRNQLATSSLSLASQAAQGVLRLFG